MYFRLTNFIRFSNETDARLTSRRARGSVWLIQPETLAFRLSLQLCDRLTFLVDYSTEFGAKRRCTRHLSTMQGTWNSVPHWHTSSDGH